MEGGGITGFGGVERALSCLCCSFAQGFVFVELRGFSAWSPTKASRRHSTPQRLNFIGLWLGRRFYLTSKQVTAVKTTHDSHRPAGTDRAAGVDEDLKMTTTTASG